MGALELYNITIPLTKRIPDGAENTGTLCKPQCREGWKEVFLQHVSRSSLLLSTLLCIYFLWQDSLGPLDDCCHSCYAFRKNEILNQRRVEKCPKGRWPNHEKVFKLKGYHFSLHPSSFRLCALKLLMELTFPTTRGRVHLF